jgi:hypothetical protein
VRARVHRDAFSVAIFAPALALAETKDIPRDPDETNFNLEQKADAGAILRRHCHRIFSSE